MNTTTQNLAPNDLGLLDQQLPERPYGVEEWHFATETAQDNFVKIEAFGQSQDHLPQPVTLGIRTAAQPGGPEKQTPPNTRYVTEHVYDAEGSVLGSVHLDRFEDNAWRAILSFGEGLPVWGSRGTAGEVTPDEAIIAAVSALWRRSQH